MSLLRYINIDYIKSNNSPQYGKLFDDLDLKNIKSTYLIPISNDIEYNIDNLLSELHIYTFNGDYIGSAYNNSINVSTDTNSLLIDIREVFKIANINKGSYKIIFNLSAPIFGNLKNKPNIDSMPLFAKEISPDRTEIKIALKSENRSASLQQFREYVNALSSTNELNNLVVNFGSNYIYKILKLRFDKNDQNVFYVKLYNPVDQEVENLSSLFITLEVIDPYIDTVILTEGEMPINGNQLKGPNFSIDVDDWQSQATIFQSWNDLLDNGAPAAQRIIDNIISSSGEVTLNIDYTDFNNYIFYSNAQSRIENFAFKMELIESYSADNSNLLSLSGSQTPFISSNYSANINRINNLISNFDPFEKWLYYHDTGSIFTHDISGSITPWPKYVLNNKYINHHSTNVLSKTWYKNTLALAKEYDRHNVNSLWWSIPEHVLMDPNNDQYVVFVNMLGHHFDNMYSYINALTQIHNKDEHPERGASNELLYHIAKSFGWNLQNTRQLSSLWLYKLGTDNLEQQLTSSNMPVLPHELQTKQIWRRIVNNLPYLLKTKGTKRSVNALMSIYGIPQTLISIKEYGGTGIDTNRPILIEDSFSYALNINNNSYIKIPQDKVNAKWYGWGNGSTCGVNNSISKTRTPDTYEIRFNTQQTGSLGALPLIMMTSGSNQDVKAALSIISAYELTGNIEISGSATYGKILFETFGDSQNIKYSDWLPIFDNDFWTIRIYNETPISGSNINNRIQISKAADCLYGRITQNSILSMSADSYEIDTVWIGGGLGSSYIQTNTLSSHNFITNKFSGSIQGYKEYFTIYDNKTFNNHVLNPRAYNTSTLSGSLYSLYRYIPFGLDLQREDRTLNSFESSSHPDQNIKPSLHEYVNFTGDQQSQYRIINETFYSEVPIIGSNTIQSEKIRIEDSYLQFQLDPIVRAEISEYDDKPVDSNRLAIVFSLADQINRDIINHMGSANLDNLMGDPDEQFTETYQLLNNKKNEYFQKYQQHNDINSFIRILSLYDYTFFEQIKQLVPGRSDLIAGILLEPHILQRSKAVLQKKPKIRNPQWDDVIKYIPSQSAKYETYRSEIEIDQDISFIDVEYNGIIDLKQDCEFDEITYSGSIISPFFISGSECIQSSGSIDIVDKYNGTKGKKPPIYNTPRPNPCYKKKECQFDAFFIKDSILKNSILNNLDNWYTSSFAETVSQSLNLSNVIQKYFKYGQKILNNQYLSQSFNTDVNKKYFIRIYARPYDTGSRNTSIDIKINNIILESPNIYYHKENGKEWIHEHRAIFTGSGIDTLQIDSKNNSTVFYTIEVHEYITKWEEEWIENIYKSFKRPVSCTYIPWNYQINECSARNRSRYLGSKLIGADINIDSPNTINKGPVVKIIKTNPNSISINQGGAEGNLRIG